MLDDEDLARTIHLHLQSLGPYIRAQDIVDFVKLPENMAKFKLKKSISLATAQRWMKKLGYRWTTTPTGQYVDGHERSDVVNYRQKVFLPRWMSIEERTRKWTADFADEDAGEQPQNLRTVVWFHDESTFYANDRRKLRWVHKNEKAVPRAKGEGASLMVTDFVSADYGWLRSLDKTKEARVIFKAGINREGYFTNEDILKQSTTAMDILAEYYPHEDHRFVFDNASTHLMRSGTALSARRMPKGTKAVGEFWGADLPVLDSDGKQVYQRDNTGKLTRKPLKNKVPMDDAQFKDGSPQKLYYPDDHSTHPGCFKGMAVLLAERGLVEESKLRYECPGFKCKPGATSCCCRRTLYSQPDFVAVESLLEAHCRSRNFGVLFLPKFHCELNFIEQCWGYSKRKYREFPASSKEADLEKNLLDALGMVSLVSMRKYACRAQWFMHAYHEGLDGKDAAWACKKYRGHRVIPSFLLASLDKPNA
jgi:DNA-directed RNA polymerase subunit N (RpoN/RPB10)